MRRLAAAAVLVLLGGARSRRATSDLPCRLPPAAFKEAGDSKLAVPVDGSAARRVVTVSATAILMRWSHR